MLCDFVFDVISLNIHFVCNLLLFNGNNRTKCFRLKPAVCFYNYSRFLLLLLFQVYSLFIIIVLKQCNMFVSEDKRSPEVLENEV